MSHSLKSWIATTRYWSFSVSALPVVAAVAYLASTRGVYAIGWLNAALSIVGVVLFHAAGNLLSDVGDYRSGADSAEAYAVPTLVKHHFEVREYLWLSGVLFLLGVALGLFIAWRSDWQLLWVGGIGFLLTVLYTRSKNVWLSDTVVFLVFGVLILLGTSIAVTGDVCYDVLLLSLPLGLITLSVLHINNTVDIRTDGSAGLHTVAMAMGERRALRVYRCYQLLPFLCVVAAVLLRWLSWPSLLCLLALPVAWGNVRRSLRYAAEGRDALLGLDQQSAKLQLLFSLTLSIGLFLSLLLQ